MARDGLSNSFAACGLVAHRIVRRRRAALRRLGLGARSAPASLAAEI
jgi:hypothetical protein